MDAFSHASGTEVATGRASSRPVLTLDIALYERMLAADDIGEDEKRAFLEALWQVIVQFVDLGFGVHPLQAAQGDAPAGSISLEDALALVVGSESSSQPGESSARPAPSRGSRVKEES